ncbi:SDR family NAD(P)-dependent oxidoreductase [Leifsonia sp. NPDC058194]|uniref:SDR family NAD(P)-dependent oxidoreductase n=1 Tax=Leifsonia sp. NPDC058194 TaxID=3346374 RepID=UPI0036DF6EF6
MSSTSASNLPLADRVAVITGASEGIGRGIALGLAAAGARTVLCGRRVDKLAEVGAAIESAGGQTETIALDVSDAASVANAANEVAARHGSIAVLVNSAGYSIDSPAWDLPSDELDTIVDVGLKGLFLCCQAFGSLMRESGYGKIINLSSTFAVGTAPGAAAYASVKAAVSHLTQALAVEWGAEGIRVNAIGPTSTLTPSRAGRRSAEQIRAFEATVPLRRMGTVDDLVPAAVFLASPASDFITGQTLFVDGGVTAR